MKKIFNYMLAATIAAFTFTSCEDVPEPYPIPEGGNGGGTELPEGTYVKESFSKDFGSFSVYTVEGTPWTIDFSTAKASGYDNTSKVTTPSKSYLVSPAIDLTNSEGAYIEFEYIYRYNRAGAENKTFITDNYTGDPTTTTWTDITGTLTEGSDWTTFENFKTNLPEQFIGKSAVVIAFYYACNDQNSATIEIKNLVVKEGSVEESDDPETEDGTYFSESFASDFGSFTVNTTKGQEWIIDFNTAKASGYVNKVNVESESYLISPVVDLTNSKEAYLEFEYILAYASNAGDNKVLITSNYNEAAPGSTTWTDMSPSYAEYVDWSTFHKAAINIPNEFIGKNNVRIAFYYNATASGSKTWEIKNAALKEGKVEEQTPETPETPESGEYLNESFASDFGAFTVNTIKGQEWIIDFSTAKASGYVNKTNIESESYLISPAINLTNSKEAYLAFEYILAYANNDGENKVLITSNYNETSPENSEWEDISEPFAEYVNWSTFHKYSKAIPEKYLGQSNVRIAFYYNASATGSKTWEVRNVILKEGKPSGDNTGSEEPGTGGGETDGNSITLVPADMGYENAAEMTTITLSDGTTLTFDAGGNQNGPKYYNTGKGIRMYPKNSVQVSSSKKIASIVMTCDVYNGVTYNASGDLQANPGTVKVADNTVTFDAINNSSCTITNISGTTGAASQVRMTQLKIVYAE